MVPQAKKNIESILHISLSDNAQVLLLSDNAQVLLASIGVEDLLGFSVAECMAGKLVLRDCIHHHDQDIAVELFSKKIQPENVSCNLRCWRAFKIDHLCALNFDQAFIRCRLLHRCG
jgi:hypothetical protein